MFRERLRQTREEKNISQTEMASKLGIAVTTYRNYENTSREPNYDILVNISKVLNVSIDYLLGNDSKAGIVENMIIQTENLSDSSLNDLKKYIEYLNYKEKKEYYK